MMERILYWILTFGCYVVAGWFCYLVTGFLIERKEGFRYRAAVVLGCMLVPNMVIYVGDLENLPPTLFLFFAAVFVGCRGSRWHRLAVSMVICTEGFAFSTLIDQYSWMEVLGSAVLRASFWIMVWLLLRRKKSPKEYHLSDSVWKLVTLITVTPLGIVLSIVLLQSPFLSSTKGAVISNVFLLALASAALFLLMQFIPVLAGKEQMEEKMKMYEMNRTYYDNLEKQQQEIRILRHDMANHLQVISGLEGKQKQDYIEKLMGSFAMGVQVKFCENRVLNGVLNVKRSAAENSGIGFQVQAMVPEALCVDDVDLCALAGNGLDNAMEACMKCPEESRYVNTVIKVDKGILAMKIENPAPEKMQCMEGMLPGTTKKASQGHGFGMRSMMEIAERYGGNLELSLSEDGKKVILLVWLPLSFPARCPADEADR
ncbi:MAG: sensor histidine kinase [Anaerovoracaceae bacterium]